MSWPVSGLVLRVSWGCLGDVLEPSGSCAQDASSKKTQGGPRWYKIASRSSQQASRWLEMDSRWLLIAPRWLKTGPRQVWTWVKRITRGLLEIKRITSELLGSLAHACTSLPDLSWIFLGPGLGGVLGCIEPVLGLASPVLGCLELS